MYDLIIIGAGSGGAGAAITAGRLGLRTLWVEKEARLGGTGVLACVNVWQPSYTVSTLAPEIFARLLVRGEAHLTGPDTSTPSGRPIYRHVPAARYQDTLRRWDDYPNRLLAPAVVYTPDGMDAVLREMALETGNVEIRTNTVFLDANTSPSSDGMRRITSVELHGPRGTQTVEAGYFIDAAADIPLAVRAGCSWVIGREAAGEYDEPSAPPAREFKLNGWTLCFMVHPGPNRVELPSEEYGNNGDWAHMGELPGGGFYVNLCLQLTGEAGWSMGAELARELMLGNIARRWPRVQQAYGLEGYGITGIAPRIGVREGPRVIGRYVLKEQDFTAGNFGKHHDDCVGFTDHALDRHSPDGGCIEAMYGPMGIPFRCLQPREIDNLLVACRGGSFSSLAGSAARLQRTMVELGEAAAQYLATGKVVAPELPPYRPWQYEARGKWSDG